MVYRYPQCLKSCYRNSIQGLGIVEFVCSMLQSSLVYTFEKVNCCSNITHQCEIINNSQLSEKRPRCYAKSSTVLDVFWPILGLISSAACGNWEMGTAISCTECSQVAGLIRKVDRSSSKLPFLCAAILCLIWIQRL